MTDVLVPQPAFSHQTYIALVLLTSPLPFIPQVLVTQVTYVSDLEFSPEISILVLHH